MNKLTISVAMCTYNGEKYLQEQLDSIFNQSRLPDELIVCDDNSSDQSISILERFSVSAPFPVKFFKNHANVGSTTNFVNAIALCEGAIIALSDQDDVWRNDKLQLIEDKFNLSPNIGAVFSNGTVVSEDLLPLGYTLWDTFNFKNRNLLMDGNAFELLLNHNVVTGATLAFRSCFRELILPISPLWVHDAWIAILLSLVSEIDFIDKELIEYRQHKDQQIGGEKKGLSEQIVISRSVRDYTAQIQQFKLLISHVEKRLSLSDDQIISKISAKVAHLKKRQEIYCSNAIEGIAMSFYELISRRYHKHSNGYRSFIKDLAVILGYD